MAEVPDRLNETLRLSIRRHTYESVKVLALYWKDGHRGYQNEGREVTNMFTNEFQYPAEQFAIPSSNASQHRDCSGREERGIALDSYYGGHVDKNDDKHERQERRSSVWAGHSTGEPTPQWFRIQDQLDDLKVSNTDVFLLLDCRFAAQAARAHEALGGRFEILAASTRGMETPSPGDTSFTTILLSEIRKTLNNEDLIDVKDLHGRICNPRSHLWATPVHISLRAGQRPIRLQPLAQTSRSELIRKYVDADDK
ncbi:uncharacterized protein BCR38DRAFT_475550 [Pseudomassariella vexata]|uniref:Uncharacterized protein n=1 Tax=Pseudomassariella vexata TaxID=1141098 RepID=A0A1Y2DSI2_9PEZI|nr:uncharacterized protein BCR38DRAFT_475550 [Pseudomassariella vexata]ORY62114.1 hypothetical protein BCR38DRAFT_475550 [Pseudomassariella vexata]